MRTRPSGGFLMFSRVYSASTLLSLKIAFPPAKFPQGFVVVNRNTSSITHSSDGHGWLSVEVPRMARNDRLALQKFFSADKINF